MKPKCKVSTDFMDMKKMIMEYYRHFCAHKFDNHMKQHNYLEDTN